MDTEPQTIDEVIDSVQQKLEERDAIMDQWGDLILGTHESVLLQMDIDLLATEITDLVPELIAEILRLRERARTKGLSA